MNIQETWEQIEREYNNNPDCSLPGRDTILGYALLFLFQHKGQVVNKRSILDFLSENQIDTNDLQVRQLKHHHFLNVDGKDSVGSGNFRLNSVGPHPSKVLEKRRKNLPVSEWDEIKKAYNNCCATCGAKEGTKHRDFVEQTVKLEKGHCDPKLPLVKGNVIPQCQVCNKTYMNNFEFSNRGFVKCISNPRAILLSSKETQIEVLKLLKSIYE